MSDDGDWFAPKQFGYGAGLPITWQGWALTIGFSVVAIAAGVCLGPHHPLAFVAILIPMTIAFMVIAAQHTRGGWKWRWKGDD
jgi:hypothetical protein